MLDSSLLVVAFGALTSMMVLSLATPAGAAQGKTTVVIDTSEGPITVELDGDKAPITVKNFLDYVDKGHYDNTVFHRVIKGFMIQGGGFEAGNPIKEKPTGDGIKNESKNGLSNARGTLAMARRQDPNSATAQFFINHADNSNLDTYGGGYAVFGKVTEGMDVVDKIAGVKTGVGKALIIPGAGQPIPQEMGDMPVSAVVIKSIKRK